MPPPGGAAGDAHGRVVLLRAVDVVREVVVERDAVELRGRLVHAACVQVRPPSLRDVRAAVVALDHALRIVGRDPQVVVVAVRRRDAVKVRPPSIDR